MKIGDKEWSDAEVTNVVIKWMKTEEEWMKNHKCSHNSEGDSSYNNKKDHFVILLVPNMWMNEYKPYVKCCRCGAIFDPLQNRVILSGRSNED